jgi:hypothetical protein
MTDHDFDELEISLDGLLQKPGLLVVRKRYWKQHTYII